MLRLPAFFVSNQIKTFKGFKGCQEIYFELLNVILSGD